MLKIFLSAMFAVQTCFAGTTGGAHSKFTPPNALDMAVAYNNISADGESLYNILSTVSNKPQEVDELKKYLGPHILKKPTLKFKRVDDNTYSAGKNTVALSDGKIRVNGKNFAYDSSKTVLSNYEKFRASFGAKKKTTLLEYLIPRAYAQEEDDGISPMAFLFGFAGIAAAFVGFFEGGGGGAFAIAAMGVGGAVAGAGAGAMFYSGDLSADEAYTPTGYCQKKGNTYTNSAVHVSGDILTQDLEAKDGQLVVTYKLNGEVRESYTVVKKGNSHEVNKLVVNGKPVDPATDPRGKLGNYFIEAYKGCVNPTKEQAECIARVNQLGKDMKAGNIKTIERTKTENKPAAGSTGAH
jgi:hypothetical protein